MWSLPHRSDILMVQKLNKHTSQCFYVRECQGKMGEHRKGILVNLNNLNSIIKLNHIYIYSWCFILPGLLAHNNEICSKEKSHQYEYFRFEVFCPFAHKNSQVGTGHLSVLPHNKRKNKISSFHPSSPQKALLETLYCLCKI